MLPFLAALLIAQVPIEQPGVYSFDIQINEPGIYEAHAIKVGDLPLPPDPPDPPLPPAGAFVQGAIPADGYKATGSEQYVVNPNLRYGQRLSGTVTIANAWMPAGVQWRLLVDGIPQASKTLDTTHIVDGTHVIACQVTDQAGYNIRSGATVVVVNNGNHPFRDLEGQAVVYRAWNGNPQANLSWGWINVLVPQAFPLDPQLDRHPVAANDVDRSRLVTDKVWWVEGLNHQGTQLWQCLPMLMRNAAGDYFVKGFNPQGGGAGIVAANAEPFVRAAPVYDGPRGIGMISPYSTLSGDRHHVLWDGNTGWIGVDKAGRVFQVSIDGEVRTMLGPRSVAGVIQTDNDLTNFTLEQRLAAGEKEYVGDNGGQPLKLSHDIWVCDSFPFEGVIADTGNNQIREIHFADETHPNAYLMRKWPIAGVTSVWGSTQLQQEKHVAWVSAAPDGLWCQRVQATEQLTAVLDENGEKIRDERGVVIAHLPPERIADIPNAFWVRVLGKRAFVITLYHSIYEYDFDAEELTERRGPDMYNGQPYDLSFVFGAIDEFGSIGPVGRLYFGAAKVKTEVRWIDTTTWQQGVVNKGNIINKPYLSWQAGTDPNGHYMWGFAPHSSMPKFVSAGIVNSSWMLWSACLGELPKTDESIGWTGTAEWRSGVPDAACSPAAVYGWNGHGMIGYSCDQFRDFQTWDDAKSAIMEALEPFFAASQSQEEREAFGRQLFLQRTRPRFW